MPPTSRKGKRPRRREQPREELAKPPTIPASAYVQAYEAQLVYGQPDVAREVTTKNTDLPESSRGRGRGLIRWEGSEGEEVWVDRYDILNLLPSLPSASTRQPSPPSPASTSSSWDTIPSDVEETFFLSGSEELEEYEREKKKRWMAALREDRLREREREEKERVRMEKPSVQTGWKGDDEIVFVLFTLQTHSLTEGKPPAPILTLMSHTALSLSASPDPRLLEMRILANYSTDDRFSFLKGRYKSTWERIKGEVRRAKADDPKKKEKEEKAVGALVGGYESSEEDEEEEGPPPPPPEEGVPDVPPSPPDEAEQVGEGSGAVENEGEQAGVEVDGAGMSEEEKRRLRRQKVEEWKRKRAAGIP